MPNILHGLDSDLIHFYVKDCTLPNAMRPGVFSMQVLNSDSCRLLFQDVGGAGGAEMARYGGRKNTVFGALIYEIGVR